MKAWPLFLIAVVLAGISVFALRYNHQTAVSMRAAILEKDRQGQDVSGNVSQLQDFVFTHMNSSIRLELVYSYERAVKQAQAEADKVNSEIYAQAQVACDRQGNLTVDNAQCVQRYLEARLDEVDTEPDLPDKDKFTYVFNAPILSFDLAGLALLGALFAATTGAVMPLLKWMRKK